MASSIMESLMCVWDSPGARASSGGPGREMSKSVATLGGERRESPPPAPPGDGGGTPFCEKNQFQARWGLTHRTSLTATRCKEKWVKLVHVCTADLWDIMMEELGVWFSFSSRSGREQQLVVSRGWSQVPTGTTWDDTRRFSCQVNSTWKSINRGWTQGICLIW